MSETKPHFSAVYGVNPPDGACYCRVRLRLKGRVGNPPSIKCESLSEEAVQAEIDASEAFRRTLEAVNEKAPLGTRPWILDADLQFFGSDGAAIDAPSKIEVTYFGVTEKPKKKRKSEPREIAEALKSFMPSVAEMASANTTANAEALKQALADLRAAYNREADRVDSAIEEMAERAKGGAQKQAQGSGFRTLIDLVSVAKEVKSFLN